ncbi:MAG TPA: VOC family protein [Negativicutes bacterium]
MAVEAFLHFNGNCREAVAFYAKVFGTESSIIFSFGDAPHSEESVLSEEAKKLVMYTSLNINGSNVMFSDTLPDMPVTVGNNINLVISGKSIEEIKAIFNQLKEGGTVFMELQETFWSKYYGMVIDKFGTSWHLNHMFKPFNS